MKHLLRIAVISAIALCIALVASPRPVGAHPMGNFSINHMSLLTIGARRVDIRYIVDMAEIPAFQELGAIRSDHSTDLTPVQRDVFVARKSAELLRNLTLAVNGRETRLSVGGASLSFPQGAGGLPTLRLEMSLSADLDAASGTLEYRDANFKERAGWKEVVAVPAGGVSFESASVPSTSLSEGLTKYNPDIAPPSVTSASVKFTPGGGVNNRQETRSPARRAGAPAASHWLRQRTDALTELIMQDELPLLAFLIALAAAFGFGAAHAFSPGHGKTVVAAYLVGTRGTAGHAALLGLTVTVSHTIGVFLLGLVVLFAADYVVPERLYPLLGVTSGLLIAVMGAGLFLQRRSAWLRSKAGAPHTHDGHTHSHDHEREHDRAVPHSHGPFGRRHTHLPTEQRVTLGSLLALGIMGGIIPCPSALVVLLVAIAYHKVALGLALILSFSLGLAAVLTGIGLLVVYGRNLLGGAGFTRSALLGRLPMASALAVACLGLLIAVQSLQ